VKVTALNTPVRKFLSVFLEKLFKYDVMLKNRQENRPGAWSRFEFVIIYVLFGFAHIRITYQPIRCTNFVLLDSVSAAI